MVLEAARILKAANPFRNSIVFLMTDGEEVGLWGAKAFVNANPWAKEIAVAVNLEARGTSGRSLMFETSENNAWLISAYAAAVKNPDASSLYFEIYHLLPNDTDLSIFKQAGMAGMNFAFIRNAAYYHTPGDNLEHLDPGSLQHQGDNALAMIRTLAAMDLSHPPQGNAIYTDLLGLAVIRWPERWAIPLAALASFAGRRHDMQSAPHPNHVATIADWRPYRMAGSGGSAGVVGNWIEMVAERVSRLAESMVCIIHLWPEPHCGRRRCLS